MTNNSTWKQQIGQQLQVANQQITLCQQKIQQDKDHPDDQLLAKCIGCSGRSMGKYRHLSA